MGPTIDQPDAGGALSREARALNAFFSRCIADGMDGEAMARAMLDVLTEGGHLEGCPSQAERKKAAAALDRIELLSSAVPGMSAGEPARALGEIARHAAALRSALRLDQTEEKGSKGGASDV